MPLRFFESTSTLLSAADRIVAAVRQRLAERSRPVLVALDGRSGSGKSTLAALVAQRPDATIIPGDNFFAADIQTWSGSAALQRSERPASAFDLVVTTSDGLWAPPVGSRRTRCCTPAPGSAV